MRPAEHRAAPLIGFITTLVIGVLLYYIGLFTSFYGMGFIFTGTILLVIPRFFGCHNIKAMILLGITFFLITTAIGAFAVSKPMLENDNCSDNSSISTQEKYDGMANISVYYNNTVNAEDIYIKFEKVAWVCYQNYHTLTNESYQYKLALSHNFWEVSDIKISTKDVYLYTFFISDEMNEKRPVESGFYSFSKSNITTLALETNAYYVGISATIFFFILFLVREFKKKLEKTRAMMETEGRLYPKGHGLCKQCGSIILPGEIRCKRCGTSVDIPHKFQVEKYEFFQCSECSAKVPMHAIVCPKCGTRFDEEDEIVFLSESTRNKPNLKV